ncbi:hypothetical protein [Marinimicrobium locisalis]|uniref:hypothetical protein n=1 Tax=Marinimicrobium locisalis TaxID=546022 RepID=UPI003221B943
MGFLFKSAQAGAAAPGLADKVSSKSYQLYRVPGQPEYVHYDKARKLYCIDVNTILTRDLESLPPPVRRYLLSLKDLPDEALLFESAIKKEYAYSTKWTDRDHILTSARP